MHTAALVRSVAFALGVLCGVTGAALADRLPESLEIAPLVRGRARSWRTAGIIAAVMVLAMLFGERKLDASGASWAGLVTDVVLASVLVSASAVDLEHMILPNALTYGGAAVALASSPFRAPGGMDGVLRAALGALVGFAAAYGPFLLYKALRRRSGMGIGDAKLLVLVGAWLAAGGALFVLFVGALLSIVTVLFLRAVGLRYPVPASVRAEIDALRVRAAAGDDDARAALADDPMASDAGDGVLAARVPLGPFLAAAALAAAAQPWLVEAALRLMTGAR